MKVILNQDVPGVGSQGDVVRVAHGHARNYLIPRGLALQATPRNLRVYQELRKKEEAAHMRLKRQAQALAEKINQASCTISAKAGEDDKLFGAVTSQDVATALGEAGFTIDKKKIDLQEPIKQLGVYNIPIKLHPEATAKLKLWVVRA